MGIFIDLSRLPEGWFLYHVGELVKPILLKGDKHEPLGWRIEFQHRDGGLLTYAEASELETAYEMALASVRELHAEYETA